MATVGTMSELATGDAKRRVAEAVTAIEQKTSAEIVVMMRPSSGRYRAADLAWGALFAFAALCVFLYHPDEFDFTWFPLEQAGAFAVGALVSAWVPPLRRLLASRAERRANVRLAARAAFVERGLSRTRGRTGVLVYLSAFERAGDVVLDVGLDEAKLGASVAAVRAASARGRIDELLSALDALGASLARAYPREADDVDELPNEVAA